MTLMRDILVPVSLLRAPHAFGGRAEADCLRGDLILKGGRAVALTPSETTDTPRVLIPALVEAHCHLDKCHSIKRMSGTGGDLAAAIAAQKRDKIHWTHQDLRQRMSRGLAELSQAGCMAVRSHIDWGESASPPLGWSVLRELAADYPALTIQSAALTGIDQLADAAFCMDLARHIAETPKGVMGAFVLHHDPVRIADGLQNAFTAADRFGLALDFHVDEGLGDYNGLEAICDAAIATGFQGPILCGHAVSLIDRAGDTLQRIVEKLGTAGIAVCALPTTNLYLQGRRSGTPDRRGLTRLRELRAAGVPVVAASDNVADAFCPLGQHDPRAALHLAALAAHLDPPMGDWLPMITRDAARALGLSPISIEDMNLAHLRLCAVSDTNDLIAGRSPLVPLPT